MSGYVTSGSRRLTLSAVGYFGSGTRHLIGQDFEPSSTTKNVRTNCSELTDPIPSPHMIPRSYGDSMRTTTTVRRLYGRLVAQNLPAQEPGGAPIGPSPCPRRDTCPFSWGFKLAW